MAKRVLTMLGVAAIAGAASLVAADYWLKSQAQARPEQGPVVSQLVAAAPPVQFATIVVANEPLRFGALLATARLKEVPWHEASVPEGAFRTLDEIDAGGDRTVLSPIEPNEPILLAKLSGPNGRATLSNLLSPGMRAVSIRTDEVAGVGGFVAIGDRVDVVLTRDAGELEENADGSAGAAGSTIASEIVVQNARVLTVGQAADERQTGPQVVNSVTLEVTPEGAKMIALARSIGTLSLSLRGAGDPEMAAPGLTTISAFGGSARQRETAGDPSNILDALDLSSGQPAQRTVVVTRRLVSENYTVVAPQN